MKISDIRNNMHVQFNIYGSMGGRTSVSGTVEGIVKGHRAPKLNEMRAYHASIYQLLPEEIKEVTPNDWRKYDYAMIALSNGDLIYVGLPWIIESTLEEVTLQGINLQGTGWDKTKLSEEDIRVFFAQFGVRITSILSN